MTLVDRQRGHTVGHAALLQFARRLARRLPAGEPASIAVCLVSDRTMRGLNRRFRCRDAPTDVLAFPGDGFPQPDGASHLGDIVISVESALRQARERGHSLARELRVLLLHGYLHLLGYDHECDDGAMLRLQRRLERELLPAASRRGR